MKKSKFSIVVMLSALLLAPISWAAETRPDTLVKETAQEVLTIIKQDKEIQSGNKAKILNLVKSKILPHFNFTRMTRLAMGKNWRKASPQQKKELEKEFRTLLVRTYYKALAVYSDHTIKVSPLKNVAGKTDTTVKTEIIQSHGQPVSIDYSMEKINSAWKVYDITVAGISLVINYRGSFNSKIRSGGVEGLLKALNKKNRMLKDKDKEKEKSAALTIKFKTT
jgi:phospholipid transport system substrate-binding protein